MRISIAALVISITLSGCFNHHPPDHVTVSKILEVQIGMSRNDVIRILDEPVKAYGNTFQYTRAYSFNYPMLWIHFDSSGVRDVYAKYYHFVDDTGIYGLTRDSHDGEIRQWGGEKLHAYFFP